MEQLLPPVFIAIAGFALLTALYAFWQSVRALFQAGAVRGHPLPPQSAARLALIDEKATLLRALKELSFERDLGKISEQDFEAMNARYRARAKQVLRELDAELGPYRKRAEALISDALGAAGAEMAESGQSALQVASTNKAAAATESAQTTASPRPNCASCKTENESDATFCKRCGGKLGGGES